jgi:truncated hemoglobin YjbI
MLSGTQDTDVKNGVNLYEAVVGGTATCRRLSESFYARVARDPVLRPLFPGKTLHCAIEEFAAFLAQFLGGPPEDTQRRWWLSLRESHRRFAIGPRERDAWMKNMIAALDDAQIEEPARSALRRFFERSSAYVVNVGEAPAAAVADERDEPASDSVPASDSIDEGLSRCWHAQRLLDEAVAAIRAGDADRAIALAESPALQTHCERRRAVFAALLAVMIGSGHRALLDYVHGTLSRMPALACERYSGRTLLHEAAVAGDVALVDLLLRLGAEPNAGVHTPLYCVGNDSKVHDGRRVVAALIRAGAHVDAPNGVKQCTALHMAARRGNLEVAEALLEHGASLEARDTLGDTPLRRAVNCDKTAVAALLLSRGADAHSKGSKGLTPSLAARSSAMRQILQSR